MTKKIRISLAQLNLTVGDLQNNLKKMIEAATIARDEQLADVIVFPELALTGYLPEDLLFRKNFIKETTDALYEFVATVQNIYCLVGHPHLNSHGLYNSCSFIYNGNILGRYDKQHLPNYGVFDEDRYFISGNSPLVIPINNIPIGVVICEDLWFPGPVQQSANHGARIILAPNASPFEIDKHELRLKNLCKRAKNDNVAIFYVNMVGGQDEVVFDGGSLIIDTQGNLCHQVSFFNETIATFEVDLTSAEIKLSCKESSASFTEEQKVYNALVLGVRDYINKNHFPGVLIGVSGGIDSALTLAIAVDALGSERVHAVTMPSRFTSDISIEDGLAVINNLNVSHQNISIEKPFNTFLEILEPSFKGGKFDTTEENLQARCRGIILMALSNKTGNIVLTTGNRSEMAVGYATLYGDMAGGFSVLKDVPKTMVYRLADYRNKISRVIPTRTIQRAPTAELAPNQKDEDSLPPYSILDKILELYLNQELSAKEIISQGFEPSVVYQVINLVLKNEYKRRQAPIGVRINNKAFGRDRRYAITSGFKEG